MNSLHGLVKAVSERTGGIILIEAPDVWHNKAHGALINKLPEKGTAIELFFDDKGKYTAWKPFNASPPAQSPQKTEVENRKEKSNGDGGTTNANNSPYAIRESALRAAISFLELKQQIHPLVFETVTQEAIVTTAKRFEKYLQEGN